MKALGKIKRAAEHALHWPAKFLRRGRLRNKSLTIISNDCWGSFMYQYFDMPFNSPFIGLFLTADDYLTLLEHPEILDTPPMMTDARHSRHAADYAHLRNYPLGVLPRGVEIHFLHYPDAETALAKWNRRVRRIDWNNCLVKFSQGHDTGNEEVARFSALPYPHKVCLTSRRYDYPCAVWLNEFDGENYFVKSYWKVSLWHYDFAAAANAIGAAPEH